MKISNQQVKNLLAKYVSQVNEQRVEQRDSPEEEVQGDRLELSKKAQQLRRVRELVEEAPEVRRERVSEIKKQLREGEYEVSAEEVAEKMIEELSSSAVRREEQQS